jgi:hypothetical protein
MSEDSTASELPKRKRTSHKASRLLIWSSALSVIGAVIALFAGQAWLEAYLKSESFRFKTESAIGRALHAKAELAPLKRQGTIVSSDSLAMDGLEGGFFRKAKIQSGRAEVDLNGLWSRKWLLTSLTFARLDLDLNISHTEIASAPTASPPSTTTPTARPWLSNLLPSRTEISAIQTDRATVTLQDAELRQTRLEAKPVEGGWAIDLDGGGLHWPGTPAMELSQARLIYKSGFNSGDSAESILRSARLLLKTGGQTTLSGQWSRNNTGEFHAQLENVTIHPFLPEWWQARLQGSLQGTLHYAKTSQNLPGEISGEIRLTGGKLEALPLLSQLDSFLGVPRFRQVPLKTATTRILRTATRTEFKDLDLDADGLLRIQGTLAIEDSQLKGTLKLGISSALLQWLPGSPTKIFAESRDGYVWAPLNVSGSVDHPVEDLSARLANTTLEAIQGGVTGALKGALNGTSNGVVKGVLDEAEKTLPKPVQFLPEAAKSFLDAAKSPLPKPDNSR